MSLKSALGWVEELLRWEANRTEQHGEPWVVVFDRRPEFLPQTLDLAQSENVFDLYVPVIDVRTNRVGDWRWRHPAEPWSAGWWHCIPDDRLSAVDTALTRMPFLVEPRPLTTGESDVLGRVAVVRCPPSCTFRDCVGGLVDHVWDEMRRHPGPEGLTPRPVLTSDPTADEIRGILDRVHRWADAITPRRAGDDVLPIRRGPRWEKARRQLIFDGIVIRNYSTKAAKNQEEILDAFEGNVTKDGWPPAVTVRLRDRQLKDAIDSLNETVSPGTIRFRRNGG